MLKANALYRDGSKLCQPLNSAALEALDVGELEPAEPAAALPAGRGGRRARGRRVPARAAAAARSPRRLHAEGHDRRPQGLPAHGRVRGRPARRDLHRHAQGGRGLPLPDELLRHRHLARPAARRAARGVRRTRSCSRASSRTAWSRATRTSSMSTSSSTTSSASSRSPTWAATSWPRPAQNDLHHDTIGKPRSERFGPASSIAATDPPRSPSSNGAGGHRPSRDQGFEEGDAVGGPSASSPSAAAALGVGLAGAPGRLADDRARRGPPQGLRGRRVLELRPADTRPQRHVPQVRDLRRDVRLQLVTRARLR